MSRDTLFISGFSFSDPGKSILNFIFCRDHKKEFLVFFLTVICALFAKSKVSALIFLFAQFF